MTRYPHIAENNALFLGLHLGFEEMCERCLDRLDAMAISQKIPTRMQGDLRSKLYGYFEMIQMNDQRTTAAIKRVATDAYSDLPSTHFYRQLTQEQFVGQVDKQLKLLHYVTQRASAITKERVEEKNMPGLRTLT